MPASADQPQSPRAPRVVAVVLTWNDVELTRDCLRTLHQSRWAPLPIVVVDNGSRFPTLEPLAEEFPDIIPVQLDRNYGFTGGCNRGIERAMELGADYVFLLNNDTLIHEDAVPELVRAMDVHPDAAIASALLVNPDGPKIVQSYKNWMHRDRAQLERPFDSVPFEEDHRATAVTEFVPACAILMRTKALREIGLFDERLFTNWEDYDLCARIADHGWKILVVGAAEVAHKVSQTTGSTSPFIIYFSTNISRFI